MSCNTTTTVATSNCPPAPEPPWARAKQTPTTQTLSQAGNISLTADPTYLDKTAASPSVPIVVALPNGNYKGQSKRIYIADDKIATTERFNLTGTFAGFTSLYFDSVGFSAILEWTGSKWMFVAGNANQEP